MNLPNRITLGRLLISLVLFVLLALIARGDLGAHSFGPAAFVLFVVAASTDWLDGWLARRRNEVTVFGRIMDPFADKVIVCGSFILLEPLSPVLSAWMVVIVVAREFFVNGIRGFLESRGISFAAEMPGKIKLTLQCIAIGTLIFHVATGAPMAEDPQWLHWLGLVTVWTAIASTVHSGWHYAVKAQQSLRELGD